MGMSYWSETYLTHFIRDTILVVRVSDIFGNNFINIGNIEIYFTESCSEGPNNQFFLDLSNQSWAGFICPSNHGLVSLKPADDWMNKFKKNWLLVNNFQWNISSIYEVISQKCQILLNWYPVWNGFDIWYLHSPLLNKINLHWWPKFGLVYKDR